jgi:ABC-type multidrug transport system fused ATPase/permease subunit
MLVSSILLTQLLFTKTSDILFLFLTLLAGISLVVSSHFLASFFGKAQLAGLYISTLVFALSLVSLAATLLPSSPYSEIATQTISQPTANIQVLVLSLIFPPYTWATLIGDVANREFELSAFSLASVYSTPEEIKLNIPPQEALKGYLYVVFFVVQIILYSAATYWVERGLWSVRRPFDRISESSDVALRCTHLSKTYYSKRPWYWPFKMVAAPNLAVQNLDLEVKKGSVTFLLGPNGGGKTTTLKCVAGMTAMDAGSRLEINEAGTVFGICPQHNVRPNLCDE